MKLKPTANLFQTASDFFYLFLVICKNYYTGFTKRANENGFLKFLLLLYFNI